MIDTGNAELAKSYKTTKILLIKKKAKEHLENCLDMTKGKREHAFSERCALL